MQDEVPEEDARLFHPRIDEWTAHFELADNGQIQPLTPTGRVTVQQLRHIPHAAESETFSRNANGVRAISVLPAFSPTPLALRLNVKGLIHGRARYNVPAQLTARLHWQQLGVYPG